DEQVFRFNARRDKDGDRFVQALKGADGRRVTWSQLTSAHPKWRAPSANAKVHAVRRRPPFDDGRISGF
ncbi:MAG TPA: hypothetical protein VIW69_02700, partial [Candidatus Elarobacter sp.]